MPWWKNFGGTAVRKLRLIRILLATLSMLGLTLSLLDFTGCTSGWLGWLAKLQFMPAALAVSVWTVLAILAVTFLCGRVYCSVLCPLGIFQDLFSFFRRLFGKRFSAAAPLAGALRTIREVLRIAIALVFFGGGFLGVHYLWLEPYSIYSRSAQTLLGPLWGMGNNALAAWAERTGRYTFAAVEVVAPAAAVVAVTAGLLALIAALAVWRGRVWCNTVCPVGTVLGQLARVAVLKPKIDAGKCVHCGLCARACKGRCIDVKNGRIDLVKCVACFDCGAVCAKGALKWSK